MTCWYLLFAGTSTDGLGTPKYVGRTTDINKAAQHYREVKQSPYSTGKVMICDNETYREATAGDFV